jgi:hypothetical protein
VNTDTVKPYRVEHHGHPMAADVVARLEYLKRDPRPSNVTLAEDGCWLIDLPMAVFLLLREDLDGTVREWFFGTASARAEFRLSGAAA